MSMMLIRPVCVRRQPTPYRTLWTKQPTLSVETANASGREIGHYKRKVTSSYRANQPVPVIPCDSDLELRLQGSGCASGEMTLLFGGLETSEKNMMFRISRPKECPKEIYPAPEGLPKDIY